MQSVVYQNPIENIEKLVLSLKQSAALALHDGVVSHITYKIGDCSPSPIIEDPQLWATQNSDDAISIEYQYFDHNYGHGGGQNELAKNASAQILGIINPDVVASPHLIEILCQEFHDEQVGIAEAAQIPFEHPKSYDIETRETTFASGCCLFIDRELFNEIDGFDDEYFFMYCDDVDLSWRVRRAHKKIVFCPDACVYHDHRLGTDSALEVGAAEFYYSAIGAVMLAYKWNRRDLAERNTAQLRADPSYNEVVAELDERIRENRIPDPISDASRVALFTTHGFAHYRWTH